MNTLHFVRKSAFSTSDFEQCLRLITHQDTVVFIDDGCYNLKHSLLHELLNTTKEDVKIACIGLHMQGRAIKDIQDTVNIIEMKDLVALTFTHKKVITWQ